MNLLRDAATFAEESEKEIKIVQGENSENLIDIYSLYSFIG